MYLQVIYVAVNYDALMSAGDTTGPVVIAEIGAAGVFGDRQNNSTYIKPLVDFLMEKFNLPFER